MAGTSPAMTAEGAAGLCEPGLRLLERRPCRHGASLSALAARLPPEFRLTREDRVSVSRLPLKLTSDQSRHERFPEHRRPRQTGRHGLFQDPVSAADRISDARRAAAARAGNPETLERDRPLRKAAPGFCRPRKIRAA